MNQVSDSMTAGSTMFGGAAGDDIQGYLARPSAGTARGGVVVIHHMPGYDRATKEITRRFAELGYDALCPNLHWRDAPGAAPDDAAAASRANGGVPDARLVGDVAGAAEFLQALPTSNGRVGTIGYCSGGRQSVLAACNLDLDAAVDCYGAFVTSNAPSSFPIAMTNLVDQLPHLRSPLLGLFGADDKNPDPAAVAELTRILRENGKDFTPHSYPDAGHGFFATDRISYRVAAANDGWERITAFFSQQLATDSAGTTNFGS